MNEQKKNYHHFNFWSFLNWEINKNVFWFPSIFLFFAFFSKKLVAIPSKIYARIKAHVLLYRSTSSKFWLSWRHAWTVSWKSKNALFYYVVKRIFLFLTTLMFRINIKLMAGRGNMERYVGLKFRFDLCRLHGDIAKTKGISFFTIASEVDHFFVRPNLGNAPLNFNFKNFRNSSYSLENKYEKFQRKWCISWKVLQETVASQIPCTIHYQAIFSPRQLPADDSRMAPW